MKTLSFRRRVHLATSWVAGGFHSAWIIEKFYIFPTEENLLISFWYDHAHYRRVVPEDTVYDFLDSRVRILEDRVVNPDGRSSARRLEGNLLRALRRASVREMIVNFLESRSPRENYRSLMEVIRGAWRMADEDEVTIRQKDDQNGELDLGSEQLLHAKAYVIAAHLLFELEGKASEFQSFSLRLPDLRNFIREKFGVERLPGRLEEFKGYSYTLVLNGKNSAKKGQLRVPFRQIEEHPEVFGQAVAAKAREILGSLNKVK